MVLAECISILSENLNMQMEAEWADLFDRRLMSLYGIDDKKATKQDMHGTEARAKHKQDKTKKPTYQTVPLSPSTS